MTQTTTTLQEPEHHAPTAEHPEHIGTVKDTAVHIYTKQSFTNPSRSYWVVQVHSPRMKDARREAYNREDDARHVAVSKLESLQAHEDRKANWKAEAQRKAQEFRQNLKVGDILTASWGYEQTNIEFYEVLRIKGGMVTVRELMHASRETGFMSGECVPIPGRYLEREPELTRRIGPGYVKINDCITAHAWDGQAEHWSSYA